MAEIALENPLTGAFEAIWNALEANSVFCTLVAPGNRLKYAVTFEPPEPDTLSESVTPYVVVVFTGFKVNPHATSSSTLPDLAFEIQVSTASQRTGPILDTIWAILLAIFAWHATINATTSGKFPYIRCVRPLDSKQENKAQKGIKGWMAAMYLEIGLNLRTHDLETVS
jgi:hypothetical protein